MINPGLDLQNLARKYDLKKRIEIPDFLETRSAEAIHKSLEHLRRSRGWFIAGDGTAEVAREKTFAYRFRSFPLKNIKYDDPKRWQAPDKLGPALKRNNPLLLAGEAMNSRRTHSLVSFITGVNLAPLSASVYASMYLPGDFITRHDDASPRKTVVGVLNFSRNWNPDWGGTLAIYDKNGKRIIEKYVPSFNTLVLFEVPLTHAVLPIRDQCAIPRYALSTLYRAPD
jgi:SM-20-related protein